MRRIDRGMPRRPVPCARLAHVFGLALAIGAAADRALAADESSEIFDILDDDRDGVITREEYLRTKIEVFYRALKEVDHDQRLGPAEINITPEAFADADINGDGKISGAGIRAGALYPVRGDRCQRRPENHLGGVPGIYSGIPALAIEQRVGSRVG
jgi:EF hand